jgi:hypothetical protein
MRLIEAKGTGTLQPQKGSHSNGLATFSEAFREYLYEKLTKVLLKHSESNQNTVPCYAVIHLGFDVKFQGSASSPAGLIVRASYGRQGPFTNPAGLPLFNTSDATTPQDAQKALQIAQNTEMTLRTYGITTSTKNEGLGWLKKGFEWVNVQMTEEGRLIDFGNYGYQDTFDLDVVFLSASYAREQPTQGAIVDLQKYGSVRLNQIEHKIPIKDPLFVAAPVASRKLEASMWRSENSGSGRNRSDPFSARIVQLGQKQNSMEWIAVQEESFAIHCEWLMPVINKLKLKKEEFTSLEKCPES